MIFRECIVCCFVQELYVESSFDVFIVLNNDRSRVVITMCGMKYLFLLRSYNTFSWCPLKFPVGIVLLDLYRVFSYLDNFFRSSSTSVSFTRGGVMQEQLM